MKTVLSSNRLRAGLKVILPISLCAVASLSSAFTFTDPTMGSFFYQKNYTKFGTLSSSLVSTTSTGGNPGNGMRVSHVVEPGEITSATALALGSAYTISPGGISHVDMGVDYQTFFNEGIAASYIGFALEQSGKRYVASVIESRSNVYSSLFAGGLTAIDFMEIDILSGVILNETSHPNFGLVGSELKFGVFSVVSTDGFPDTVTTYFDNLSVNVTEAVPEPASLVAASIGLVGLVRRRTRKSS